MKFKINKKTLAPLVKAIADVAMKSIMPDYTFGRKITLQTSSNALYLMTSNGFVDVKCKLDESNDKELTSDIEDGICTIDAAKFKEIIDKFDSSNKQSVLAFSLSDNMLSIKDGTGKTKRSAQMPVADQNHQIDIKIPIKAEKHTISSDVFSSMLNATIPFVGQMNYKLELGYLCVDMDQNELTCVCGDGGLYAVARNSSVSLPNIKEKTRRYFPVDQLPLIMAFVENTEHVELFFKNDSTTIFSLNNGTQIVLKGIPQLTYTHYENFAFRSDDAKYILDVQRHNLRTAMEFMGAAEDKEPNDASYFLKCHMVMSNDNSNLTIRVDESNKYRCEEDLECHGYNVGQMESFHIEMYADILMSLARQSKTSYLRFFLIEENGLLNAQAIDLQDAVDDRGLPKISDSELGITLSYFFATVREMA